MQLDAEQLGQILRSLAAESMQSADGEHRRAPRISVPFEADIQLLGEGPEAAPRHVQLRDVSPRGLSFTYPVAIEKGTQFLLLLPGAAGQNTRILATVVHNRRAGQLYRMGAEMMCATPQDQVRAVDTVELDRIRHSMMTECGDADSTGTTQPSPAADGRERRRARRDPQFGQVTLVPMRMGRPLPAITGILEDLSCRGMCIGCANPMETGDQFIVRFAKGRNEIVTILCSVAHCRPGKAGRYQIGAEFLSNLATAEAGGEQKVESDELVDRIRASILAEQSAA